jgi:hypothetical protein
MGAWTDQDLRRIGDAEELEIAPVRRTGELRRATPIWVVRAGEDLYVRAAYAAYRAKYGARYAGIVGSITVRSTAPRRCA